MKENLIFFFKFICSRKHRFHQVNLKIFVENLAFSAKFQELKTMLRFKQKSVSKS